MSAPLHKWREDFGVSLHMKGRGRHWVAISAGLLAIALSGIAYATIPDSNGVIHGCYQKTTGSLRVIDTDVGQSCTPSEKTLSWNKEGPPGPSGPPGSALAYAYVAQDGSMFNSKNVTAVTHPSTGVWCFDLPFTPHVAVATVTGFAFLGNQIIHTSIPPGASDACTSPNPDDAAAFMVLPDGTRTDYQFFIMFN
jgi:hypothetical protein